MNTRIRIENAPGSGGMLGASKIAMAVPDGLTIGIINAPGLLAVSLSGGAKAPNPVKDFSILGRVVRSRQLWVTAWNSGLKTMQDVLIESRKRPIIFAITDVGSTNFINIAVASKILGIRSEYVAGYPGSRESSMAVLRGEADIVGMTFESGLDRIEAGDLRPLLQIDAKRISSHDSLHGVAILGGRQGLAASRAAETGGDIEEDIALAGALISLTQAGRLIVAPPGLDKKVMNCLERRLYESLTDPAFRMAASKARRSLDVADGASARADILAAGDKAEKLAPIVINAIKKTRS
jgi:tripartite-type tricarboxylate transporter receptor subunit TctC